MEDDVQSEPKRGKNDADKLLGRQWAPLVAVGVMGLVIIIVLVIGLIIEMNVYDDVLANAREATRACPGVYLAYTAAMVPFRTFAWFRTAAVMLSFVFVFAGTAFVLGQVRGDFSLQGKANEDGSFEAQSPYAGVLMMLLGAALVAAGMYRDASPHVEGLECTPNPAWSKGRGKEFEPDEKIALNSARPDCPPTSPSAMSTGTTSAQPQPPASATTASSASAGASP